MRSYGRKPAAAASAQYDGRLRLRPPRQDHRQETYRLIRPREEILRHNRV